jgi:glycosyltransferase involved in cell wall biosynthesis
MRIMHISTRLILGGSQENTVLSCEGQATEGHDVSLVFGPIYGPEGSLFERASSFRTPDGRPIECIETPNLVRDLHPFKDSRCYRDLKTLIREWKPDVVHTHSSKAGILGRLAAWKQDVPCVIHTVHGPPFHRYEKRWRNAVYIRSERFAARRCHKIVCVAEAMRHQFLAARIGTPEQYEIVYSGMEVEPYLVPMERDEIRARLGLRPGDFVAGTVARLAELKGHDDLLDALGDVMRHRPELKLLWVGDGWWRKRLMDRVRIMGLEERVITTGLLPPEQIPRFMRAMDVLIHPSYREGLPRTITQGSLSALATIAYDVDGTREVCLDHQTGLLVAPGDLQVLQAAVLWMMDHPEERTAMGVQGRAICRSRFAIGPMVTNLERLYQSALNARPSLKSAKPRAAERVAR